MNRRRTFHVNDRASAQLRAAQANLEALRSASPRAADAAKSLELMRAAGVSAGEVGCTMRAVADVAAAMGATLRRAFETFASAFRPRLELVVDDPAARRPTSLRELLEQMRDLVLHEFWLAAERPERSPGARYVRARRRG